MILPVMVYGMPVLRKTAERVDKNHPELQQLIDDMFETMHRSDGVGLAAPQVGHSLQLFVIDATKEEGDPSLIDFKKVFINPEIISESGELNLFNEGCLSIPDIREDVERLSDIHIIYYDRDFNLHEENFNGTKARIIQHEYDHLKGILFTDKVSPLKKKLLRGKLNNISKGRIETKYRIVFPGK